MNLLIRNKKNDGFVLFFSLLLSSIILAAGLAVSRIVVRQILLASVQKDSQMALFAADSGIECARYWQTQLTLSSASCNKDSIGNPQSLGARLLLWTNNGTTPTWQMLPGTLNVKNQKDIDPISPPGFFFNVGDNVYGEYCVKIKYGISTLQGIEHNYIDSSGYNVPCDSSGNLSGGRVVERTLRFTQ